MAFVPKAWMNAPATITPISAAALIDLETRVTDYADEIVAPVDQGAYVVTNYGATGDGINDDTDAIQDAIDAAGNGGVVFLPPGTYIVSALDITNGIVLAGASQSSTIIKAKTGSTGVSYSGSPGALISFRHDLPTSVPQNESHVWGSGLRDITVDGNGRTVDVYGVELRNVDRLVFDRVLVRHFAKSGIYCERSLREAELNDIYVRHCGDINNAAVWINENIVSGDGSNEVFFYGLRVVHPHGTCLRIEQADAASEGPVRTIYFIGGMLHGSSDDNFEPDEDGYTFAAESYELYSGHCAHIADARYVHFIGVSFHRSGRGKALVRTAQGSYNGASSVNKVFLTDCYFGATNNHSTTFTASNGSGNLLLTFPSNQMLSSNAVVRFTTTGSLPTGITTGTDYFLRRLSNTTAEVSTTNGGSAIAFAVGGNTGTHTLTTRDLAVDNGWGQTKLSQHDYASIGDGTGASRFINRTGLATDLQATSYSNL